METGHRTFHGSELVARSFSFGQSGFTTRSIPSLIPLYKSPRARNRCNDYHTEYGDGEQMTVSGRIRRQTPIPTAFLMCLLK